MRPSGTPRDPRRREETGSKIHRGRRGSLGKPKAAGRRRNFANFLTRAPRKAEKADGPTLHARDRPVRRARPPLLAAWGAGGPRPRRRPAPSREAREQGPHSPPGAPRAVHRRALAEGSRPRRPRAQEAGSHLRVGRRRAARARPGRASRAQVPRRRGRGGDGLQQVPRRVAPQRAQLASVPEPVRTQTSSPRPAKQKTLLFLSARGATQPRQVPASGPG
ncbi:unnamed protein product [Rangifer tarandus platyrhynchus]|uniref:Uncharacterized protein n=2 Tax=Rangifer tarandus platyrhynchus TaxID=3082113 RepID=A0ABN8Z2V4_RANTA|nr:unnamed protein product [Rangifer tarandus platyrhynchus]CAI9704785.1 unnamed protein product [Rangifer tarandus platyrhynchus]